MLSPEKELEGATLAGATLTAWGVTASITARCKTWNAVFSFLRKSENPLSFG